MRVTDIAAAADIAHRGGALLIVDNTFASPYFQRPLELGADIVYHSTTKYLNGHSDMIGGCAVVVDDGIAERLQFIHNAAGAVAGPFDAWLALRGTKTLHLRMRQHDANGREIAKWLVEQVGHENVFYIGLPTHPQHELVRRQMTGFGGMISVELGTRERAAHVLERVRVFSLAESLGGVESLISQPAGMTHASVPPERRAAMGLSDGLDPALVRGGGRRRPARRSGAGVRRLEREAGSGKREAGARHNRQRRSVGYQALAPRVSHRGFSLTTSLFPFRPWLVFR